MTLPCKILVITPAHLAFDGLIRIYSQIQCALTDEIRWYIKDSGKCDLTAQFFLNRRHVNLDRTPDSGIYDAINIALVNSDSSHYLILGADDLVNNDALITALIRVKKHPDVLFHFYKTKLMPNDVITSYRNIPLRWSNASIMPSHSAGTIISRLAHDRYGEYSTDFRILGDAYFVLNAIHSGASYCRFNEVLGSFELGGISSSPSFLRVREWFSCQVMVFGSKSLILYFFLLLKILQLCLYLFRRKVTSIKNFLNFL